MNYNNKNKFLQTIVYSILLLIFSSISVHARILQETSSFISSFFSSMPQAYQIKILLSLILFFILSAIINMSSTFEKSPKSKSVMYFAALLFSALLTVGIPDDFALLIVEELGTIFGWIVLSLPLLFIILFFWAEKSLKKSLGDDDKAENFLEVIFTLLTVVVLNFTSRFMYNASSVSFLSGTLSNGILETYGDILTILMIVYMIKLGFSIFHFFNHNVKFKETSNAIGKTTKSIARTTKDYLREKKLAAAEKKTISELINLDLIEGKDISVLKNILSKLDSIIRYFSNPRIWDKIDAGALQELSRKLRSLENEGISQAIKLVKDFRIESAQNEQLRKELSKIASLDKMSNAHTRGLFKSRFRDITNGKLSYLQKKLNELHASIKNELAILGRLDKEIEILIEESEKLAVKLEHDLKKLASEINLILSTMHNLTNEEKEQAANKLRQLTSRIEVLREEAERIEQNRDKLERLLKEVENITNDEKMRILAEISLNNNIDDFLRHINQHVNIKS